jgi:tetrahydromethanopterin S-methyltransferase subunit G
MINKKRLKRNLKLYGVVLGYLFLLLFTVVLFVVLTSAGFLWAVITRIHKPKELAQYLYDSALSYDQTGAMVCSKWFNDWFVKPNGHRFGNPDETASHVFGKNLKQDTLYLFGYFIAYIINAVAALMGDVHHVEKAANNEQ